MIIYKVTNKLNGKCYIGQTVKTIDERKKTHQWGDSLLMKAINKYGDDNFIWEILDDTCQTYNELLEMETHYIHQCHSYCKDWGYNLTYGGEGSLGRECKKDTRNKISQSNKGKIPWNKGLTKDDDDRLKIISENMIGHKVGDKSRKKMSKSAKNRCDNDHKKRFLNIMTNDEVIQKRVETAKNNGSFKDSNNPRWNKNLDENKLISLYGTMNTSRLSKEMGVPYNTLSRRIKKLKEQGKI